MYSTSVPSRFHFTLFPFFPLSTLYLSCVFIVPSLLVADTGTIGDLSFSQARTFGFSGARDPHTPSLGCHSKESVLPHHTLFHSIHTTIIPMTVTRVFSLASRARYAHHVVTGPTSNLSFFATSYLQLRNVNVKARCRYTLPYSGHRQAQLPFIHLSPIKVWRLPTPCLDRLYRRTLEDRAAYSISVPLRTQIQWCAS